VTYKRILSWIGKLLLCFLFISSVVIGPTSLANSVWNYPFPTYIYQWYQTNCTITQFIYIIQRGKFGAIDFAQWQYEVSYVSQSGNYESGKIARISLNSLNQENIDSETNPYLVNTTLCWIPPGVVSNYLDVQRTEYDPKQPQFNNIRSVFFSVDSSQLQSLGSQNIGLLVSGIFFTIVACTFVMFLLALMIYQDVSKFKAGRIKPIEPEIAMARCVLILHSAKKNGKPRHPKCQFSRLPLETIYTILYYAVQKEFHVLKTTHT